MSEKRGALILLFIISILLGCSKDTPVHYEVKTSASPKEGGTTSPAAATFESNEEVTISAIPSKGYYFDQWQGDIKGTSNPLTFTIKSDTELTAVFLELDQDKDGVPDEVDKCPDTADGAQVNEDGCSPEQSDSDNDGVNDALDQCPDSPSGEQVNSVGCPSDQPDADGDGVEDDLDQCDNTPAGEQADSQWCSPSQKDSDGDGVSDATDQCTDTPQGATVNDFGCLEGETDGDGDGVSNEVDECPNTPSGEVVDEKGCSVTQNDEDGDGVTDEKDQCIGTPSGESVDLNGCSDSQKDSDEDGVSDELDQCPETPSGEVVDAQGCSEGQSDEEAPVITNVDITNITTTSFRVDWTLNEGSKGYIRFGTSPGVYIGTTNIANNYLTHHIQTVGGNNPFDLQPATTDDRQIYTEDQYGNSGFSSEFTVTTLNESGQRPFIFNHVSVEWSSTYTVWIPTDPSLNYNYTVDWGDGHIESNFTTDAYHIYENADKIYDVKITGSFPRIYFGEFDSFSRRTYTTIKQWGDQEWVTMEDALSVESVSVTATDIPNLSKCTSLRNMFQNTNLSINESIRNWNVSNITDMKGMFRGSRFNRDISSWNVSNVTDMSYMFADGEQYSSSSTTYVRGSFNQNLSLWNVSSVTDMSGMFIGCDFNKTISTWDVSKVTDMSWMFYGSRFNQDISSWNVSNVEDMSYMFGSQEYYGTLIGDFNQDITSWNIASLRDMSGMFYSSRYNQPLENLNVSNVTKMSHVSVRRI